MSEKQITGGGKEEQEEGSTYFSYEMLYFTSVSGF